MAFKFTRSDFHGCARRKSSKNGSGEAKAEINIQYKRSRREIAAQFGSPRFGEFSRPQFYLENRGLKLEAGKPENPQTGKSALPI